MDILYVKKKKKQQTNKIAIFVLKHSVQHIQYGHAHTPYTRYLM